MLLGEKKNMLNPVDNLAHIFFWPWWFFSPSFWLRVCKNGENAAFFQCQIFFYDFDKFLWNEKGFLLLFRWSQMGYLLTDTSVCFVLSTKTHTCMRRKKLYLGLKMAEVFFHSKTFLFVVSTFASLLYESVFFHWKGGQKRGGVFRGLGSNKHFDTLQKFSLFWRSH